MSKGLCGLAAAVKRILKVHARPGECGGGRGGGAEAFTSSLSDRKVQGRERERSRLYLSKFRLYLAFFTSVNMVIVCMAHP